MTCDARQMFVTFTHQHIFKALDKTKIDSTDAAALIGEINLNNKKRPRSKFFAKKFFQKIKLFPMSFGLRYHFCFEGFLSYNYFFFEICLSNFEYYNE